MRIFVHLLCVYITSVVFVYILLFILMFLLLEQQIIYVFYNKIYWM